MFDKLLPQPIDNKYSGSKIALWLFGLIVFVHILQSVMVIVNGQMVARSADGIPLENYPGRGRANNPGHLHGLFAQTIDHLADMCGRVVAISQRRAADVCRTRP